MEDFVYAKLACCTGDITCIIMNINLGIIWLLDIKSAGRGIKSN